MLRAIFGSFIDILLPPRRTEALVRTLTLEHLRDMQTTEGLPYHDPDVTALIWELKYHASPRAAQLGGELLAEEVLAIAAEELGKPLLIPIPMHPDRRKQRGHNQTEVLCEAVLRALIKNGSKNSLVDVPVEGRPEDFFDGIFDYAPHALERTKNTPSQQGLERMKRLKNIKDSMQVKNPEAIKDRVCIVVDDVSTTGATFAEATRALRAAGATRVWCVALAQS